MQGRALIKDLDQQSLVHQHSIDFLDEAINDIKQLDYDIVKEISELKTAYTFNQEILKRASRVSLSANTSGRTSPRGDCSALAAGGAGKAAATAASVANSVAISVANGTAFDVDRRHIIAAAPVTQHVPVSDPAVWQGIKECAPTKVHIATSPFTKSLCKMLLTKTDSPRNSLENIPRPREGSSGSSKLKESIYSGLRERSCSPIPIQEGRESLSGKYRGVVPESPGGSRMRSFAPDSPVNVDGDTIALPTSSAAGKPLPSRLIISPLSPTASTVVSPNSAITPRSGESERNRCISPVGDSELVWGGAERKRRSLQSCSVPLQALLSSSAASSSQPKGKPSRPKSEEMPSFMFKAPWSPTSSSANGSSNANGTPPAILHPASIPHHHSVGCVGSGKILGHHDAEGEMMRSRSDSDAYLRNGCAVEGIAPAGIADLSLPRSHGNMVFPIPHHAHSTVNLTSMLKRFPDEPILSPDETDEDQIEINKRIRKCRLVSTRTV